MKATLIISSPLLTSEKAAAAAPGLEAYMSQALTAGCPALEPQVALRVVVCVWGDALDQIALTAEHASDSLVEHCLNSMIASHAMGLIGGQAPASGFEIIRDWEPGEQRGVVDTGVLSS